MKKLLSLFSILATSLIISLPAYATLVTYEFTINGADLMSYVTADGVDGSTAIKNGIYDGARLFRNYSSDSGWGNYDRSYQNSSNTAFTNWADSSDDKFVEFNLWGYDGNGTNWGEIYKVYDWADTPAASDANWDGYLTDWPWGNFDDYANSKPGYGAHYNDGQLLGWETTGYANGLGFGSGEADATFTFQMTLNMDDPAFYGETSPWYNEANREMVFWFGGWTQASSGEWSGLYEGNIILQGTAVIIQDTAVPEPGTIVLLGFGLLGLGLVSRKRLEK